MVEPSRFTPSSVGGASAAARPTRAGRRFRATLGVVACTTSLSFAAPLVSPVAVAAPASMTELAANISQAQANIDRLNLNIGDLQEKVNQALVDLQDSRARAEQARRGAEEAKKRLAASEEAVVEARKALDEVTRSQYRGAGQSKSLDFAISGDDQKDVLDRSLFLRQRTEERRAKLAEVERARTEAANDEATQREASEHAASTAAEAEAAEAEVRALLDSANSELAQEQSQRDAAQLELDAAQSELDQQRADANGDADTTESSESAEGTEGAAGTETDAPAQQQVEQTDGSALAAAPEQQVTADEVPDDVVVRVEQHAAQIDPAVASLSSETVAQALTTAATANGENLQTAPAENAESGANAAAMSSNLEISDEMITAAAGIIAAAAMVGSSQANHTSLDNPYGGSSNSEVIAAFAGGLSNALGGGAANVSPTSDDYASPEVSDGLASLLPEVGTAESVSDAVSNAVSGSNSGSIETVISRAQAMIGTPYVWGGGDANGPTTGVNGGSVSGFDCSGLVLYAFAGVGISLPHYTGYQYQRGTQVPASEAQRGDLLFWGPGGSQHVAIYLGDGTMIEAPQAGQNVQISPVRYSGMAPMAVRLL
nr:NlpC/P60 family protein [uncultured Corynebacterium sp.]